MAWILKSERTIDWQLKWFIVIARCSERAHDLWTGNTHKNLIKNWLDSHIILVFTASTIGRSIETYQCLECYWQFFKQENKWDRLLTEMVNVYFVANDFNRIIHSNSSAAMNNYQSIIINIPFENFDNWKFFFDWMKWIYI